MKMTLLKNETIDVFVRDVFRGAADTVARLRETALFRNVLLIRIKHDMQMSDIWRYYHKLLPSGLIHKYIEPDILKTLSYDVAYAYFYTVMPWNFFSYFKQRNPSLALFMVEDGIGSYTMDSNAASRKSVLLRKYLRIKPFSADRISGLYLYSPRAATVKTSVPLLQMPKLSRVNKDMVAVVNRVFSYDDADFEPYRDKKIIYLEQPTSLDSFEIEKDNGLAFLELLCRHADKKDILVKLHPRRPYAFYDKYGYDVADKTTAIFEVMMLNHSFADKLVISEMSAALLSPKNIFDEEPRVIATFLTDRRGAVFRSSPLLLEAYTRLFQNFKASYHDQNKFSIPTSEEDLNRALASK